MEEIRGVNSVLYLKSGETVKKVYKRTGGHYTTLKGKSVI